jgi:hypothetical protein
MPNQTDPADDCARSAPPRREFTVRIAARFLKDPAISADAKALRAVLGAYADGHTGRSYVHPRTLEAVLRWGRGRRESAQRELARGGWLRLERKRPAKGQFGRRIYVLLCPDDHRSLSPQRSKRAVISVTTYTADPSAVPIDGQVSQVGQVIQNHNL